jgi:hypothetical protein
MNDAMTALTVTTAQKYTASSYGFMFLRARRLRMSAQFGSRRNSATTEP